MKTTMITFKNLRISSGDYVYAIHLLSQLIVITWMCDHSRCCKLKLRHHYRRSNNFSYLVIFGLNKICVTKTQFTWLRHRWSLKLILNFLRSRTKIDQKAQPTFLMLYPSGEQSSITLPKTTF